MSPADKQRIRVLASRGLGATVIAADIGRHPSTVNWFMYSDGLRAPKQTDQPSSYLRNGRRVHRFTRAEDAYIVEQRLAGEHYTRVAELASLRFGTERTAHVIRCRLIMLAALEEES